MSEADDKLSLPADKVSEYEEMTADKFRDVFPTRIRVRRHRDGETLGSGSKVLHLLRHGQGFHNLLVDTYSALGVTFKTDGSDKSNNNPHRKVEVTDAPLTFRGRQEAISLAPKTAALASQPEVVIVSPLSRSIATTLLSFRHLVSDDGKSSAVPFLALESVRETFGIHYCDCRRARSELTLDFPMVDFSLLDSDPDPVDHSVRESLHDGVRRCYAFLEWLKTREERVIAVGTHSSWLFRLFNGALDCCDASLGTKFAVGELRSVVLDFDTT